MVNEFYQTVCDEHEGESVLQTSVLRKCDCVDDGTYMLGVNSCETNT